MDASTQNAFPLGPAQNKIAQNAFVVSNPSSFPTQQNEKAKSFTSRSDSSKPIILCYCGKIARNLHHKEKGYSYYTSNSYESGSGGCCNFYLLEEQVPSYLEALRISSQNNNQFMLTQVREINENIINLMHKIYAVYDLDTRLARIEKCLLNLDLNVNSRPLQEFTNSKTDQIYLGLRDIHQMLKNSGIFGGDPNIAISQETMQEVDNLMKHEGKN